MVPAMGVEPIVVQGLNLLRLPIPPRRDKMVPPMGLEPTRKDPGP